MYHMLLYYGDIVYYSDVLLLLIRLHIEQYEGK
jgi:hypothetical protein